jgi:hypothetical protein
MSSEGKIRATERDVETGNAIFSISDERSRVYDIGIPLPVTATTRDEMTTSDNSKLAKGTQIKVIQVEIVDERDILVGFRVGQESGVCFLNQVLIKGSEG